MQHLLGALERALSANNHYAALALALTLPDIVGWVRDPLATSRRRCINWFEQYMGPKYFRPTQYAVPQHQFLSGNDFYALRCAYLHEGRDEILSQRARDVLEDFQFVVPPAGWTVHCNQMNNTLQLQVDVFCQDIAAGILACLDDLTEDTAAQGRLRTLLLVKDVNGIAIK